ncbi:hypothetical protein ABH931_000066 [Streptacidiphilus sp. MAP12-33]|uniref:hypothetical protein n=1 Tax=Streptacidiphilus sp. MAP12-33 TaxID=3156266 RepID=UPI003512E00A
MAARRSDLVKADGSIVPGLREDPGEVEFVSGTPDDSTREQRLNPEDVLSQAPDARDIAAELAAPPRRKLPWLTLLLVAGVLGAGSFVAGAMVEKNSGTSSAGSAASAFAKLRSGATGGASGFPGLGGAAGAGAAGSAAGGGTGASGFGGGGGGGGGATTGTVKLVDGNTIYLTDSSGNIVKVTTTGSTTVSIAKSSTVSRLQPGQSVTVRGTTDSSGNVTATTVSEGGSTAGAGGTRG